MSDCLLQCFSLFGNILSPSFAQTHKKRSPWYFLGRKGPVPFSCINPRPNTLEKNEWHCVFISELWRRQSRAYYWDDCFPIFKDRFVLSIMNCTPKDTRSGSIIEHSHGINWTSRHTFGISQFGTETLLLRVLVIQLGCVTNFMNSSAGLKFKVKKKKYYNWVDFFSFLFHQYIWVVSLKRDKSNKSD